LPVLDAQRDLYLAKRDYAQSRYDYLINRLRLKQAAGTLAETDLVQRQCGAQNALTHRPAPVAATTASPWRQGRPQGGRRPEGTGDRQFESSGWARLRMRRTLHTLPAAGSTSSAAPLRASSVASWSCARPRLGTFTPARSGPRASKAARGWRPWSSAPCSSARSRSTALKRVARRQDPVFIAHPILVDDELYGAAAVRGRGPLRVGAVREVVQRLGWGIGWLEALARRKTFTSKARLVTVLELIATSLQHERFQAAATAVATELATTFGCERVSIGFMKGRHIQLRALSHSAAFAKKTNLVRAIEGAMDEAADQLATVVFPARKDGPFQVTRAHAELLQQHGTGAVCTIPLTAGPKVLGALVLELPVGAEFDARTVELCEHAALLVGPVLDVKRREDRWLIDQGPGQRRHAHGATWSARAMSR
jgi:hypothetical protein